MKAVYAITGSAFFLAAFIALIAVGPVAVQKLAIFSAISAGYSQFAAQDESQIARYVSIAFAYAAMVMAVVAAYAL